MPVRRRSAYGHVSVALLLLAGLLIAGCAPHQAVPDTTTLTGVPARVGAEPLTSVVLRLDDGARVTLTGPLSDELARAAAADVRVRGVSGQTPFGPALEVAAYRVLRVDGIAVTDGLLVRRADGECLQTDDSTCQPAAGLPADLPAGSRLWAELAPGGYALRYGVLRRGDPRTPDATMGAGTQP